MKIAYIVDSTAGLKPELREHPDVYVVNLTIQFANGEVYEDSTDDVIVRQFYETLKQQPEPPKTAQPSPGVYHELVEKLIESGYEAILAIHLSSKISGTYQTAYMILQEYAQRVKVAVIDSKGVSVVIENALEQALQLQEKGNSFEQIVEKIEWVVEHAHIYMMIDDLNYLVKGGRLSSANAILGSLLKIKPLLEFTTTGEVQVIEKIRTEKRVFQKWETFVQEAINQFSQGVHIRFAHGESYETLLELQDKMKRAFPEIVSFGMGYLTPVVGVYGGNGVKGIALIPNVLN